MATQYQLVMHSGPTPGKTFPLEGDIITIGREAGNGIVINDAEVSRKHAQLSFQGGKFVVSDIGSTNGTFVNGQRITGQHVLSAGEVISLGEQINLLFEALVQIDPNATMLSAAAGRPAAAAPRPSTPAPTPAAQPVQSVGYAGQVPVGPEPGMAAPPPRGGSNRTLIIVAVVIVVLLCCCVGGIFIYDFADLWCSPLTSWLVPVISGGSCP